MITKKQKGVIVDELVEKLSRVSGLYIVDYVGLTVDDVQELRAQFREQKVDFKVAKNTLIKRALAEVDGLEIPDESLIGMTALAFGYTDPVAPAKVLKDFIKKHEKPALKSAILDGEFYDGSRLEEITKFPSREDMIAGILAGINEPATGIVRALIDPPKGIVSSIEAVTRELAHVIEEVAKKNAA